MTYNVFGGKLNHTLLLMANAKSNGFYEFGIGSFKHGPTNSNDRKKQVSKNYFSSWHQNANY